jgi:hypothetical protein
MEMAELYEQLSAGEWKPQFQGDQGTHRCPIQHVVFLHPTAICCRAKQSAREVLTSEDISRYHILDYANITALAHRLLITLTGS